MKKATLSIAILLVATMQFYSVNAYCQPKYSFPPQNIYWMLTSNTGTRNVTTLQFYNDSNSLIYEEKVYHVKFRLSKVKTLRWVKEALDMALTVFNQINARLTTEWLPSLKNHFLATFAACNFLSLEGPEVSKTRSE